MRFATVAVLLLAVVAPLRAEDDKVKKDLKALEGTWNVESLEYNGKDIKDKYKLSFVFKGDQVTVEGDDKVKKEYATFKLKLDPTGMPKVMDLTVSGGVQKDAVLEGIYELKDDELKICVMVFGKDRPTEFKSPEGGSIALVTLKRQK
jgi:uncharacterized protein (TIGR03067 family)